MSRLPGIPLATTILLTGLGLTACAGTSAPPRLYTAQPTTAMSRSEQTVDNTRSMKLSDTRCRFYDGDRTRGWRHEVCVGNYEYHTGIYFRFKEVITPRSCAEIQGTFIVRVPKTFTIPGLNRKKWYSYAWNHRAKRELFTCKH